MGGVVIVSLLYTTYLLSYISRKNIVFLAPHLLTEGFTKSDLGASQSAFTACYLISKLSSNIVTTWSAPRTLLAIGISGVGAVNLLAGSLGMVHILWVLWGLNGLFCGMCWPPIGKIVVDTFPENMRGTIWSILVTSMNMGSTLCPVFVDLLVSISSWEMSLISIGLINITIGFILMTILPKHDNTSDVKSTGENTADGGNWEWGMLFNKFMTLVAISYCILTFAIITMSTWGQLFFMETLRTDTLTAGSIVSVYEIGGFCGSMFSGVVADYIAQRVPTTASPRAFPAAFCCAIASISAFLFQVYSHSDIGCRVCAFTFGFGAFGVIAMFGLMAREYVKSEFSGILTAYLVIASQTGAFCAGSPLAWFYSNHSIAEGFGIVACVLPIAFLCFLALTAVDKRYKEKTG